MPHYRVYVLDKHDQLMGAVKLDCTDDETAKEQAKQLANGYKVQLWRLVAQMKSESPRRRSRALAS
jgi:hypothetical protein